MNSSNYKNAISIDYQSKKGSGPSLHPFLVFFIFIFKVANRSGPYVLELEPCQPEPLQCNVLGANFQNLKIFAVLLVRTSVQGWVRTRGAVGLPSWYLPFYPTRPPAPLFDGESARVNINTTFNT